MFGSQGFELALSFESSYKATSWTANRLSCNLSDNTGIMTDAAAATKVFSIPELLELILSSLPEDTIHQQIATLRFIYLSRTTSRVWHDLILNSTPIRQKLFLPTRFVDDVDAYSIKSAFPTADPNPWIPQLLLHQRSWGSAYPFDNTYSAYNLHPSEPKYWTFSFEVSRAQYSRFPTARPWREMLASSPPFTAFWYTRSFYELGSGRAPFVTYLDYEPGKPKAKQLYTVENPRGVTLGMLVDAVTELMEKHLDAKFVMIESLRTGDGVDGRSGELPKTKGWMPGLSAERDSGGAGEL